MDTKLTKMSAIKKRHLKMRNRMLLVQIVQEIEVLYYMHIHQAGTVFSVRCLDRAHEIIDFTLKVMGSESLSGIRRIKRILYRGKNNSNCSH